MDLEKRVKELEKRVSVLELQVQEQPVKENIEKITEMLASGITINLSRLTYQEKERGRL